jgi:hypothetical protein
LQSLRDRVVELIPQKQKELKEVSSKYAEKSLGNVTVSQAIGGARDVKCMLWETSLLDAHEVGAMRTPSHPTAAAHAVVRMRQERGVPRDRSPFGASARPRRPICR